MRQDGWIFPAPQPKMAGNVLEIAVLMYRMKTSLKILAVVAVVVCLFLGLKSMKSRSTAPNEPVTEVETAGTENDLPGKLETSPNANPIQPAPGTTAQAETTSPTAAATDPGAMAEWEQKIDDALVSGKDEAETGRAILEMFPTLPPEGQISAAEHIGNLLANEDYAPFAGYLTNSATSTDVYEIIFADLLNRPNNIKLPMLLEVARNGKPEQATEAKDFLEVFIGEDYGTDWNTWQVKVAEWLKENPDEPTPDSNGAAVSN